MMTVLARLVAGALLLHITLAARCEAGSSDLDKFSKIRLEMSCGQVRALVGQPDRETGFGLSIEVCRLSDGSEVNVAWAGSRLMYVTHGTRTLLRRSQAQR